MFPFFAKRYLSFFFCLFSFEWSVATQKLNNCVFPSCKSKCTRQRRALKVNFSLSIIIIWINYIYKYTSFAPQIHTNEINCNFMDIKHSPFEWNEKRVREKKTAATHPSGNAHSEACARIFIAMHIYFNVKSSKESEHYTFSRKKIFIVCWWLCRT